MRLLRRVAAVVAVVAITGTSVLLAAALAPGLPWWAWLFGVAFWALLVRRRRVAASGALDQPADPGAARFSGFSGGGL